MQSAPSISFSGSIPDNYDKFLGPTYFEPYARDLAERIKKLQVKNVLEVAAGTGRLTKMLPAVLGKDAVVTATDLNPAMVKFGETHVPGVKWQTADAMSLPFADNFFDCVVVQFGVMFYPDRVAAFRETLRVMKPGGTFIFNTWNEMTTNRPTLLAEQIVQYFFPVDTPTFFQVPYSYWDTQLMRSDLEKAGFRQIETELVKLTAPSQSAANLAKGLLQGTPVVTAIEERDAGKLPEMVEQLAVALAKEYGRESLQIPLQAWVVKATKQV